MFRTILLATLLLPALVMPARAFQNSDSLEQQLRVAKGDSARIALLESLTLIYIRSDIRKAEQYNNTALQAAMKLGNPRLLANAWSDRADIFKVHAEFDKALDALSRASKIYLDAGDSLEVAGCLTDKGLILTQKNEFEQALVNYLAAEQIFLKTDKKKSLSRVYNSLGNLYVEQKDYPRALEYFRKSLKINTDIGFRMGCSVNLVNIGNAYSAMKQYDTAILYAEQALPIKIELNDRLGIGKCINNIGLAFANKGEPEKAIPWHEKALSHCLADSNTVDIAMCNINLGFDHLQAGHYDQAIVYGQKGLDLSTTIGNLKFMTEAARILAAAFEKRGNYSQAFRYLKLNKKYGDSLEKQLNYKSVSEIMARFNQARNESEIKELKIRETQQALTAQRFRSRAYLFGALLVLVSLAVVFFFYRARTNRKVSLRLQEINEMKSRFFANLSHEFRTPLTLMIGPADKLLERARPEDRTWLELIRRNAGRLLYLDEQLMEFTKIDSGQQQVRLMKGDIVLAARIIGNSFEVLASKSGIAYSQSYPETSLEALFDPDILEKSLNNLLSNALKYTPAGRSVTFTVRTEEMPAGQAPGTPGEPQSFIRFDVADTGNGIPAGRREQIFERFFQLSRPAGNSYSGSGIGLALTRELIGLHRGTVTLESAEGAGSTFTLRLPLGAGAYTREEIASAGTWTENLALELQAVEEAPVQPQPVQPAGEAPLPPAGGDRPHVLVVDDHRDMLLYIREILQDHFRVTEASDGDEALSLALKHTPDIIVTDVMMERMDGLELCAKLKENPRTHHIPVVMLTALANVEDRLAGLETGADDYLGKPFSPAELVARLRNMITRRELLKRLFTGELRLEPGLPDVTPADTKFLQKLVSVVEEHIDSPTLDVNLLSDQAGLSRSQLHRRLTSLTGQPATSFIRMIRMKRAAQLMEQRAGNISEVMYSVGFDNLSYFSKSFREFHGVSPSEYASGDRAA